MGQLSAGSRSGSDVKANTTDSRNSFLNSWLDAFTDRSSGKNEGTVNISDSGYTMNDKSFTFETVRDLSLSGLQTIKDIVGAIQYADTVAKQYQKEVTQAIFTPWKIEERQEQVSEQLSKLFTGSEIEQLYAKYEDSFASNFISFETYVKEDIKEARFENMMESLFSKQEIAEMKESYENSFSSVFESFSDYVKEDVAEARFEAALEKYFSPKQISEFKEEYENSFVSNFISFESYMKDDIQQESFAEQIGKYFTDEEIGAFKEDYDSSFSSFFESFEEYMEDHIDDAKNEADKQRSEKIESTIEKMFSSEEISEFREAYENSIASEYISFENYMTEHIDEQRFSDLVDKFFSQDQQSEMVIDYQTNFSDDMSYRDYVNDKIDEIKQEELFEAELEQYFSPEQISELKEDYQAAHGEDSNYSFQDYMSDQILEIQENKSEEGVDKAEDFRESNETFAVKETKEEEEPERPSDDVPLEERHEYNLIELQAEIAGIVSGAITPEIEHIDTVAEETTLSENMDTTLNSDLVDEFDETLKNYFSEGEIEDFREEYEASHDDDQTFEEYMQEKIEERQGEEHDGRAMGSNRR